LPSCGRGVVVPTSTKPKPRPSRASMWAPSLSSPAAQPTGLGNSRPSKRVGWGLGRVPSSGLRPSRQADSSPFRARRWARSASMWKRKGRASPYMGVSEVELDALGQRQRVGVVDGVGLAPHVGLPRIRARLAATAGFLLAAEGAADLGAGGADVDVGDAAVAAGGREEGLGGLRVLGEDGRAQALRHVVLHLDGLLQLAVLHHVQDRREGFLLNDGVAVLQAGDDGRQYVEAGPVQGGAAGLDL